MSESTEDDELYLEINPQILEEAKQVVNETGATGLSGPTALTGFPIFYVSPLSDNLVRALAVVKSKSGTTYKVGLLSAKNLN